MIVEGFNVSKIKYDRLMNKARGGLAVEVGKVAVVRDFSVS